MEQVDISANFRIDNIIQEISQKPTWSGKEIVSKLQGYKNHISAGIKESGEFIPSPKRKKVDVIKRYDVLYLPLLGIPHYFLVHRVIDECVYGLVLTSKSKGHSIHQIEKDRYFKGSYLTTSYLTVDLKEALESFVRVYESRPEADKVFKEVKSFYDTVLLQRTKPKAKTKKFDIIRIIGKAV